MTQTSLYNELLEEVHKHLDCSHQNWLFGAGISYNSNIPLMYPLTEKIARSLTKGNKTVYEAINSVFSDEVHIEHILSHIGDLMAILDRSNSKEITINNFKYKRTKLVDLYGEIIEKVGKIVRFGYTNDGQKEIEGTIAKPIVGIEQHQRFVKSLFNRKSNIENRSTINFFTTNYDTLLEDALCLFKKEVIDGFVGGGIGYWEPNVFDQNLSRKNTYNLYKLHGSIDWFVDEKSGLVRCRYGTKYLSETSNLLIYPQATKYVETQKDPFAFLFGKFRGHLKVDADNVLIACGYSFGDSHINDEIEIAMSKPQNNTTLLIFIKEVSERGVEDANLPIVLREWLDNSKFNERVFVLTDKGIYNTSSTLVNSKEVCDWWSFEGLTKLLD